MRVKKKRKQARVGNKMCLASSNCRFRLVFHNANGRMDGRTDRQTLLYRCEDASKKNTRRKKTRMKKKMKEKETQA